MKRPHKHAVQMAEYASDARSSETPYKFWEFLDATGVWRDCVTHPRWDTYSLYRHKKINLGG